MSAPRYTPAEWLVKSAGGEVWRWVPGYEGFYRVSDRGRVESVCRQVRSWNGSCWCLRTLQGRILSIDKCQGKYFVGLRRGGESLGFGVAELVLTAFIGPRPDGMEVCHFPDRDRSNNSVENLRWDTSAANQRDKIIHGTTTRGRRVNAGEANGMVKISDTEVARIRRLWATGRYRQVDLCRLMGLRPERISVIVRGKARK